VNNRGRTHQLIEGETLDKSQSIGASKTTRQRVGAHAFPTSLGLLVSVGFGFNGGMGPSGCPSVVGSNATVSAASTSLSILEQLGEDGGELQAVGRAATVLIRRAIRAHPRRHGVLRALPPSYSHYLCLMQCEELLLAVLNLATQTLRRASSGQLIAPEPLHTMSHHPQHRHESWRRTCSPAATMDRGMPRQSGRSTGDVGESITKGDNDMQCRRRKTNLSDVRREGSHSDGHCQARSKARVRRF